MASATATPKAPNMPAPSTGAAATAPFVPLVATLLDVPFKVPVEDPAAPVVVALTALAVALPAVTTIGIYPDLA